MDSKLQELKAKVEAEEKKLEKTRKEFKEAVKKMKAENDKASEAIPMSKKEICDQIRRTRSATKFLSAMLPELDSADENRLTRASEPVPEVHEDVPVASTSGSRIQGSRR